jgi:putative endonuclease
MHHLERGRAGEDAAAAWYAERGYAVVARNWRCRAGEVDLIVEKDGVVVFCEVKARASSVFGIPAEAVTRSKQLRLRRLAATWLAAHPVARRRDVRFDVVSVRGTAVEVVEAAF